MAREQTTEAVERLGIRHPIIQGPFGGGLSTAALAATVSNLGGLGSFGAENVAPHDIASVTNAIRALTPHPFAVNLWVDDGTTEQGSMSEADYDRLRQIFEPYFRELGAEWPERPARFRHRFDEQVDALLEARPPVFSFVFGVPHASILAECARRGITTMGTATTVDEARALDDARVNIVVASGFEAGGHRASFLAPAGESLMGTFVLTQLIAARVKAPVVAAGGIADARGVRAALTLGAGAAQVGSAFLACDESGASAEHRAMLRGECGPIATTLTRAFSGRLARAIHNRWTDEVGPQLPELPSYAVHRWIISQLRRAAETKQRTDVVPLFGGQIAPVLHHKSAAAVMGALVS